MTDIPVTNNPEEDIARPWDRREGEPDAWYTIFITYYLPLGSRRSLRRAFELFLRAEAPERYSDLDPDTRPHQPQHWNKKAVEFDWVLRARAYDDEQLDLAAIQIESVLQLLRDKSREAALALVEALSNDRTRVQAANSILNRAGVPETTEISLKGSATITSDEMAAAAEKVDEWKKSKLVSSG